MIRGCTISGSSSECVPRIEIHDLRTQAVEVIPQSEWLGDPSWSPDERYIAAHNHELNRLLLFDFQNRKWTEIAQGGAFAGSFWTADSKSVLFQDYFGKANQPVFRFRPGNRAPELVTSFETTLPSGVVLFALTGLSPDGDPVVTMVRNNADIYALDLSLP